MLVVEDEPLYRDLLVNAIVSRIPDVSVVGHFATGEEALAAVGPDDVDVLLTDIDLGAGMTGTVLGVEMRRRTTTRGVVLLSNLALPGVLTTLPADVQGGWSYLLKTSVSDVEQLGTAIEAASAGEVVVDEALVDDFVVTLSGRSVESIVSDLITALDITGAELGMNPRVTAVLLYVRNSTPRSAGSLG